MRYVEVDCCGYLKSLGALSGWDLRVRPASADCPTAMYSVKTNVFSTTDARITFFTIQY